MTAAHVTTPGDRDRTRGAGDACVPTVGVDGCRGRLAPLAPRGDRLRDVVRRPQLHDRGRGRTRRRNALRRARVRSPARGGHECAPRDSRLLPLRQRAHDARRIALRRRAEPSHARGPGPRCRVGLGRHRDAADPGRGAVLHSRGAVLRHLARGALRHHAREPLAGRTPLRAPLVRAAHRSGSALPLGHPPRHRRDVLRGSSRCRVRGDRPRLARPAPGRIVAGERRQRRAPPPTQGARHRRRRDRCRARGGTGGNGARAHAARSLRASRRDHAAVRSDGVPEPARRIPRATRRTSRRPRCSRCAGSSRAT